MEMGAVMVDNTPVVFESPLAEASARQRAAADPRRSVFVSANAGSGKTRVLVSRVSRLLLSGVAPAKILCLTFTKAAAAEMQARLFEALGEWSVMGDEALQKDLSNLDGDNRLRSPEALASARRLFAQALETPEGLKIYTIHAFCERILRRFPVEAGIAPGYDSADDRDKKDMLAAIKMKLARRALASPQGELAAAINILSAESDDSVIDGLYDWAAGQNYEVMEWQETGLSPLANILGIEAGLTPEQAKIQAWEGAPKNDIRVAAEELRWHKNVTNQAAGQAIQDALCAGDALKSYEIYAPVFFTQKDVPRSRVSSARIADDLFGSKDNYGTEALRMFAALERVKAAQLLQKTGAIFTLSGEVARQYRKAKRARRLMDFNDQIRLTRALLTNSAARDWVRYKLDNGVDHVLVDEAQDNSAVQWDIIDAISEEFSAEQTSARTRFAVGDEKQSIYSFQGAKPELFLDRIQAETLLLSDTQFIPLSMSFRSAPQILRFVDAVFNDCEAGEQMFSAAPVGDLPSHIAHRADIGRAELWPLTLAPQKGEGESAWSFDQIIAPATDPITKLGGAPVDSLSQSSSREQLAVSIARKIKLWLDEGESVFDRELNGPRPMRAGDIMILVRKRSAFFDAVIRNLKLAGVAVAGADKLKLTESIGVQDLISLGRFIALPSDDLSLAEVLKSPIFGLDDKDLIALTAPQNGKKQNLWERLNTAEGTQFYEARASLRKITSFAPGLAPYELYARILATLMPNQAGQSGQSGGAGGAPQSVLRRLYGRLGLEAADPIEAFLSRALTYQRSGAPSLDGFLSEMAGDGSELKRDAGGAGNQVRVMTVHGAKGLESPVVILPDTTQIPTDRAGGFNIDKLPNGDGYVARQKKGDISQCLSHIPQCAEAARGQEYLRQLYVALTRAESRLVICGFQSGGANAALKEGTWYHWASCAFDALGMPAADDCDDGLRAFGERALAARSSALKPDKIVVPDWAQFTAPAEPPNKRRITPSHLLGAGGLPAARSPLAGLTGLGGLGTAKGSDAMRFGRGIMIHKLLEILPDLAPPRRRPIASDYLDAQPHMSAALKGDIIATVFGVLDAPQFSSLFGAGSRAEVSLAGTASGLPEGIYINAQIDRLAVSGNEVWIVDYKSNRPPPQTARQVSPAYIAQMAAYRALAREIYPKHAVRCALLWTDAPSLMELGDEVLDSFDLHTAILGKQT